MPTSSSAISLIASGSNPGVGASSPDWLGFLAALHPLLVHFPIALVVVGALTEAIGMIRGRSKLGPTAMSAIVIGTLAAALSSWSGWVNADWNGYARDGGTVFVHQWLGLGTAGLLAVVLCCAVLSRVREVWTWPLNAARWGLLFGAVLVSATAHFGGSLVYGETYLVDALFPDRATSAPPTALAETDGDAETTERAVGDATEARDGAGEPARAVATDDGADVAASSRRVSFLRDVRPIFETNCFKCHGPTGRAKAGIRLHDEATLLAVEFGQAFIAPGSVDDSLVWHVVTLPRDDDMAMPPSGDGLSDVEKATLRRWISEGASFAEEADEGGAVTEIAPAADPTDLVETDDADATAEDAGSPTADSAAAAALLAERVRVAPLLAERGVLVLPLFEGADALVVNASLADPAWTDADLALLTPFAGDLVELNMARSALTDACAPSLSSFRSLERVRLERTAVGDDVARVLATLPALAIANLYATRVGDEGVSALAANASLQRVYLWNSRATPEGVAAAKESAANPAIRFEGVEPRATDEPESTGEDAPEAGGDDLEIDEEIDDDGAGEDDESDADDGADD